MDRDDIQNEIEQRGMVSSATGSPRNVQSTPPQPEESSGSMLAFAWRRMWLIIFAVTVASALGYLYFLRQTPVYQSTSELLIVHKGDVLPIESVEADSGYTDGLATLLTSAVVVEKAVENDDLGALSSLRGLDNPTSAIVRGLRVSGSSARAGELIRFTYQSQIPEDCPKVLDAVIGAYQDFLSKTYKDVNEETIKLITKAKDELDRQLTETENKRRELRYDSPLIYEGESARSVHEGRLLAIESVRSQAVLENSKLQADIDAIRAAMDRGTSREAINLMVGHAQDLSETGAGDETAVGSPGTSTEDQIFPLLLEEQLLLEKYGADHPEVQQVHRRIEIMRGHLQVKNTVEVKTEDEPEPKDFFEIYLESLSGQIKMNERTIVGMTDLFEKERKSAKSLATYQIADETYRSEVARKERLFNAVLNRLEEINLAQDIRGIETQITQSPGQAKQIEPDMKRILTTAGILGLLAGLGLAYLVDMADRRFRSPDELRGYLGLPIVGHIPVMPASKPKKRKRIEGISEGIETLDATLRTAHHPRGRVAEAYRAVRTALYFSARGGDHRVIQVTSPNSGDGKTTLAANLSVAIANSGKRVLLIDADFRRPRVHPLFGLENSVGMATVIEGTAEISEAVQETPIEHLTVLTCGERPENPSELLTSRRFQELLDVLREQYDAVIVDTPPLLAVTDPSVVAPRVDSVVLVMRLSKHARRDGHRAVEILDSVGARVLGIVVNGLGTGGGYEKYKYGGGYGYGYGGYGDDSYRYGGYGYGYGDEGSSGRPKVKITPS